MKKILSAILVLGLLAGGRSAFAQSAYTPYSSWAFISASAGNAQGATAYLEAGSLGSTAAQGAAATAYTIAPSSGTAHSLECRNATPADNSTGVSYTLYDGGNATSLTCSTNTSGSTTLCSDLTHVAGIAAGDLISIKVVNANTTNANGVTECSFIVDNH